MVPPDNILQYAHLLEVGKLTPWARIIQVTEALLAQVWYVLQFQTNTFKSKILSVEN